MRERTWPAEWSGWIAAPIRSNRCIPRWPAWPRRFSLTCTACGRQGIDQSFWAEGNEILEHNGEYQKNLTLARLGILPFFWLTCFLVWRFMAKQFSQAHAAIAVFFVAFCPVVLAHSGLATTDAPLMATFLWSLIALDSLLDKPTWSTAAVAGLAIAVASLTKFTELPFLACSGGLLFLYYWVSKKRFPVQWRPLLLAAAIFALTIWAGYRFSHGPVIDPSRLAADRVEKFANLPSWKKDILLFRYVPANEFFLGFKESWFQGRIGRQASYLLGQVYNGGRWYFFPVALLVKTQIPMLLFSIAGTAWIFLSRELRWTRRSVFLIAGALGPLAIGMAGTMNIGLRHILPIYPFLAMLSAVAVVNLWQLRVSPSVTVSARAAVVVLLVWNVVSCWRAAPDFIAYFNEPAAPYASAILVESDLDWGQDLKRLRTELERRQVQDAWISYFGSANLRKSFRKLDMSCGRTTGPPGGSRSAKLNSGRIPRLTVGCFRIPTAALDIPSGFIISRPPPPPSSRVNG